jgi:hypothetical protein
MKGGFITFFYCLLLSACNNIFTTKNKVKESLPGTYVNHSAGSYSSAFDTLIISKESEEGNSFLIERRVSFQKIRHGVLQSKEYHLEHWLAMYDDKTKVLTETKRGKILSYNPDKQKLYLNNSVYQKIEQ